MTAAKNKSYRHHVAVIAAIVVIITSGYAVSSDVNVVDVIADVMFTTMLDVAYAVHGTLTLTPTDNIDDDDGTLELEGADGITTFTLSDGNTYAAVASQVDDGVQILNVTDPTAITATHQIDDTTTLELEGADGITTFTLSDGNTYAAVASLDDNGVQILNVTDPTAITATHQIDDTTTLELAGASGITTFTLSDGNTYAAVASEVDNGVQILNVTDPTAITATDRITGSSLELEGATAITTFTLSDGNTYAAVASRIDNGVQILNVTDPTAITATAQITDNGSLELEGAHDVTTFTSDGNTYAAVASWDDNGVQILNVTDPTAITATAQITDDGTVVLGTANEITIFTSGDHTYAAVASQHDGSGASNTGGVQILDVTDPTAITATAQITDSGDLELDVAAGIATFTLSDNKTYIAVTAYVDDGVQIMRVDFSIHGNTPTGAFVTTWDATTSPRTVSIPVEVHTGETLSVSWGDGESSTHTTNGTISHTYDTAGEYQVAMTGGLSRINLGASDSTASLLESIDQWGDIEWATMNSAFGGAYSMVYNAVDAPDLSGVTDMSSMFGSPRFNYASFNQPLNDWDVSSVTDMSSMFNNALAFNQPLNDWNVSSVTDMSIMFENTRAFNQTLNDWDVSSVTDMSSMFGGTRAFNQPLNDWNVSSVTDMSSMFGGPRFIPASFNQPLNDWDVSSVTDMSSMFYGTTSFDQPLNDWDVSSVTSMSSMFFLADSFNGNISDWDVSSVTDMSSMFFFVGTTAFNGTLNNWNVSSVTDMSNMFAGTFLFNQPLNDWDVSSVTNMATMFGSATSFDQPLNDWDVSSVTDMSGMFGGSRFISTAFNGTLNDWNVSSVTDMSNMFFFARAFNQPLNNWNVSSVTDMSRMFAGATAFDQPLNDWNVSSVIGMAAMFGATSFNQPLNDWNVSSVTDMSNMFYGTTSFDQPLNDWDVSSVTDMRGMFNGATSFNQPLNDWDVSSVTDMSSMFGGATAFNQNLGNWYVVSNSTSIASSDVPGIVGSISAQNLRLNEHDPTYSIVTGSDSTRFEIVPDNQLNMTSVGTKSDYTVNVTASGGSVFEDGNNWRLLEIEVTDQTTDITPPAISGAVAASLNSVTVRFSENVNADATDGSHWSLGRTDAGSLTVSANTNPAGSSNSMTLTLSGDLPDTGPDLSLIYIKPTTGGITDGNNQLEDATVTVVDGIAPTVTGTRATSGTVIALTISEDVSDNSATPGDFSLSGVASSPTVSSISVSGITVTLTLSSTIVTSDSPLLSYSRTSGFVQDVSNNSLADFSSVAVDTSADITPPAISGAVAASLNSVTVRFSENVNADATDGSHWSLGRTDAGSLTVSANTNPAGSSNSMTLTLSGDLPDTGPDLSLIYIKPTTGGITDGNNQLEDATVTVVDGIAPTVTGTRATSGTVIALTISEDVSDNSATPGDFSLSGVASSPTVSSISVSGITVTLTLSSTIVTSDSPLLSYSRTSGFVQDVSNNSLADFSSVAVDTSADITPPAISGAVAASLNSVTVRFSENVNADATDGSHWSLGRTDAGSLTVSANTNPAGSSNSMTLTLSGDLPDTGPDLSLIYIKPTTGGITDGNNQLEDATVTVVDGIAPTVTGTRATSGTVIALTISEDVSDNSATPGDFSLSGVASSPTVSSISVSGITVTLTLSSTIVTSDSPLLSYSRTSGFVQDVSNNSLADFSSVAVDTSADITPPAISGAVAASLNSVTVRFSENVNADATDGSHWSLGRTDAGSLTVSANTNPAGSSNSMTLTLSGDLPDTGPDLSLIYIKPTTGGITDGNNQLEDATVTVVDGIAPTVTGTRATSGTVIALTISEDVSDNSATPGDFSLSGVASSPTVSSISVSGITVTLTLSSTIVTSDSPLLSYSRTSGFVQDVSNNSLADFSSVTVDTSADITPPAISGAVAASLNSVTVRFSENVNADATDGSHWSLGRTDAGSLTVSANTNPAGSSNSMTLTLSGDLPDTGPDLSLIYIKPTTGGITDGNNQLEDATVTVVDGIAPTVTGTRATSGTVIALTISEDVSDNSATPGDFSLSGVASSPTVSSISVSGITVTLTLSSTIVTSDSPLLSYSRTSGFVQDVSNNSLADFSSVTVDTSADITPPSISGAVAASLNSVTVRFSENVNADATDGSHWSLGRTDAGSLTVSANTNPAGSSNSMTLTLSGDLPDTGPDLSLIYIKPTTGGITDGNNQLEDATVTVVDGIAPTVTGTRATSGTVIALTISEDVSDNSATPGDFSLSGVASSPTVSSISVSGITVTLTLSSTIVTSDSPLLSYSRTSGFVQDVSNNSLADFSSVTVDTSADITPPAISGAVAASLNSVTVRFSENVNADATDGSHWSLGRTDAGSLTVSANTNPAGSSNSMTLTLSGDLPDTGPDLSLIYIKPTTGGITDGNNQLEDATVTVVDGIAPTVTGTRATSGTVIALTISEDVSDNSATPGDFSLSGVASSPTVSSISVSGITVTLTLSSTIVTSDSPLLSYSRTSGFVQDVSNNSLADFSSVTVDTSADITPPAISGAVAASLNSVTVRFSENVNADATDGSHWSLGRTDAGSLTVSANTNPAGSSNSMTLTLSGDLPDTGPDLSLIYIKPTTGGITDGNNQLEDATVTVVDGIAPTVTGTRATSGTVIALTISEDVSDNSATPGDFSLSGVASSPTVSSISVSGITVTLTLSSTIVTSDSPLLSYSRTSGFVQDVSNNSLADFSSVTVDTSADITPPAISGAVAASLNSVTVRFSENVNADATDGSHWSLGRTDAGSLTVSANTNPAGSSNSMTLTLSGDLPDTGPDLSLIYIKPTTGGITDGNNQLEDATVTVVDGIAPTVTGTRATSGTVIALTISEDVSDNSATPGDFSLSGVASSPTVSSISVSGITVTLTLSSTIVTSDSPLLSYSRTSGFVQDVSNNSLADFSSVTVDTSADITPPSISGAVAASLNSVTVRFSENVNADATDGSHWSLGRTDAGSLTVSANTNPAGSSNSMTLTLSGDLPDTGPDLSLIYIKPTTGGITDGNNQLEDATVTVVDGIAPTVTGTRATSGTVIALTISEDVSDNSATPGDFSLSGVASSPTVSSISVSGITVTLTLSSTIVTSDSPLLSYSRTSGFVQDVSNNSLADFSSVTVDTSADITPPAISGAVAASLNSVTVRFSENVNADATDGSHWSLGRTDAGSLTVSANTNPAGSSNSMTLTLSGDLPDTGPDLSLIYIKPTTGGITDGNNQLEDATVTVVDGIAPTVTGTRATSGTVIALTISEDVSDNSATPGDFSLSGVASSPTVSSISVSGITVTLTLSSTIVTSDSPLLSYSRTSGFVQDVSNNSLADFSSVAVDTSADITPPAISGAVAASLNSVTVRFSENVNADATDGSHWSLGRTDAGSLTVSANTNPAGSSNSMTLTLSGDLPDTGPDLSLIYIKPTTGGITDGNNQLEDATVTVVDGIAPTVTGTRATSGTVIALTISEDVSDNSATPGDFSLSGVASSPTVSSISVSGITVTLTLSSTIVTSDSPLLSYSRTSGFVQDVSNNSLADFSSVAVDTSADITPPSISGAVAASLNSVTVRFSENVNADATDGSHWSLGRTDAGSLTVSANTNPAGSSNSMTLTLSGDLPDTGPDLSLIYIKPTTGGITDGNNQLEDATVIVVDGIAPTVTGTRATSGTVIALTISEDVSDNSATPGDFSLSGVASSPTVSSISVSGITVTLTLSSTIVTSDSPLLSYSRTSGFVQDVSTNPLADFSSVAVDTSADITPPSISGAVAASLNSVTVRFSENVNADATDGSHWSLGRTDAGSLTVSANTNPAGSSNSMTLTLSGDLPDTGPDLSLIYIKPTTGGITDGNNQLEDATVTVVDGIAPTVTGTRATSGTVIALTISEDVSDNSATPGDFSLSGVASSPTVSSISVSGITVTLTLSSTIVTSDSPLLSYSRTSGFVQDVSTNPLADFSSVAVDTSADITPPSISGAVAASLNSVTVRFSENVNADATDGSHWSLGRTDAGSLTVSANTNPAGSSNSMTLTLSGDLPDTGPDLSLIYIKPTTGGITDGNNQLEDATVTVVDGIAPTVTGTRATSGTVIALTISEDVSDNSATPGDFSLSGVASSPTVSSISVSGITVTLTLSSTIVTSDSPLLSYSRTSGFVQDVSTNPLADFSSVAVDTSADITPPTVTSLTASEQSPTNSTNAVFTVTFSEDVTFAGDILVTGGTASPARPTGTASSFTFTVTPAGDGEVTVQTPASSANDNVGNGNLASDIASLTFDRTEPVITPPGSIRLELGDRYMQPAATCSDAIDHNPAVTVTVDDVDVNQVGVYTLTHACTDDAGNSVTATSTVTVFDPSGFATTITTDSGSLTNSASVDFTVAFEEELGTDTLVASEIEVSPPVTVSNLARGSDDTYTFTLAGLTDNTYTVTVPQGVVNSTLGNPNSIASIRVTVDRTAPTVTSLTASEHSSTNVQGATFTATFSEPVAFDSGISDISVTGGAASNLSPSGTASSFTFTVTPAGDGEVTVQVLSGTTRDGAGNYNTASGIAFLTFDRTAPTVTSLTASEQSPTNSADAVFTVTFSEDVTFAGDILVTGGTASPARPTGTASSFTFTVTPDGDGEVTVRIPPGTIRDGAGNGNPSMAETTLEFDRTAPTVTSLTASEQSPTNSTNAVFTVTFSEDVTFAGDILVTGGTASPARPTGTASSFTFTVTPAGDGEVTVQTPASSANDNVGNGNLASDIASLTFDRTDPVITPPSSIRLELGDRYMQPAATCSDAIDHNPAVTVTVDDVDVNQVGVYTLTHACTDDAGNSVTATSTVTVFDPSGFATSITSDPASPTSSPSVEFTVTFEEAPGANEVLTEDEIHVSPESPILNLAVSGIDSNVYTFRLGNLNGTYQVSVQNGAVNNALGTPNAIAGIRVVVDRTDPAIVPPIGTVIQIGHPYHDATCTDNLDGNPVLTAIGAVDTGLEGTYPVTYRCTDALGNSSILDVVFTVINDPPEFRSASLGKVSKEMVLRFSEPVLPASPLSGIYAHDTGNSTRVDIQGTTSPDTHSSTVTIALDDEVFEQIVKMDAPQIDIDAMAFSDEYGKVMAEPVSNLALWLTSPSRGGGEHPPIIDLGTLAYQRLADIPPHIAEQAASHDASEPLEPITPDDTFDLPLVIDGYGYLLDDTTNTLVPQTVRAGDNSITHITFTVYTQKDLAHFILYLNLQGENTDYADSDTYITYEGDGTTVVTDPHGYITGATITVTHEDDQVPEKKTVRIIVEFAEPMGPTNMVAYLWNTDRKAVFIRVIDALDVVAAPPQEPEMQAADPEPVPLDGQMPADPEPVPLDGQMPADPEPIPSDILWFDDYDEAQVLHIIRMWSGFESEFITDTQLLELLGLEDYQDVDLPDWMMTQLGVLVAKGDVTVGEFVLALQYVLTHA